jgi:ubiquinone/menaquinone biosynthesis C-methylase UbiE
MSWLMAAIYDRFMEGMERACGHAWRSALLADLRGDVLEIGAGTGRNLEHYQDLSRLVLTEPDPHMRRRLKAVSREARNASAIEVVTWDASRLPCADASFDVVVCTLVLCSVPEPGRALAEIRRVLRPSGKLVFIEHVASPDASRLAWQRRTEPVWRLIAGNCHVCRDTAQAIEDAGFVFEAITHESARKALPIVRPTIRGVARVPQLGHE